MPAIRAPKDFWAGILYLCIGATAIIMARSYSFGSGPRMGPGSFPTVLGGLLMLIGVAALGKSMLREGGPIGDIGWRPLAFVTLGTVLFGLLLEPAGAVIAICALLGTVYFASRESRPDLVTFFSFLALVAFCVFVFIEGLGVPMSILGAWFER